MTRKSAFSLGSGILSDDDETIQWITVCPSSTTLGSGKKVTCIPSLVLTDSEAESVQEGTQFCQDELTTPSPAMISKSVRPDIYGQVHPVETPELIANARQKFEEELRLLPKKKVYWLWQAQKKCPELLTDDFKLLFLRAEVFKPAVSTTCLLPL